MGKRAWNVLCELQYESRKSSVDEPAGRVSQCLRQLCATSGPLAKTDGSLPGGIALPSVLRMTTKLDGRRGRMQ